MYLLYRTNSEVLTFNSTSNTQNFSSRNLIVSHYPHVDVTVFIFPIVYVCPGNLPLEDKAEQMVAAQISEGGLKTKGHLLRTQPGMFHV